MASTKVFRIGPNKTVFRVGTTRLTVRGGGGGGSLPSVANILGAVIVEDPAGTRIARRLRNADIDPDFAISSFLAGVTVLEIGASAVTPAFTAAYVPVSPLEALLDDDEGSAQKDVSSTPTAFSSAETFLKTANNDAVQFTLSVREIAAPPSAQIQAFETINWQPRTFWGVDVDGLSTEADIEGLANSALDNNRNRTFTVTAGAGQHIYYAFPSAYGTPTFTVGGFEGGFVLEASAVSVTNAFGVMQTYDLWKSINPNLGATTVVVT